jgi:hypothetical protein
MNLTAHQPVYIPWLGFFDKVSLADHFVWFDDVQYQKKDWNNRNRIQTVNGEIWLSVPVRNKGHREIKIRDIKINNDAPWARKHLKTIELAYKKSQYFEKYFDFFSDVYSRHWDYLSELNLFIVRWVLIDLGINVPITFLSELGAEGRKSDLVLDMCKKLNASKYIFGGEGKNYADINTFKEAGVSPIFQEFSCPRYPQLHGQSENCLSIVDLLFNCGEKSREIIKEANPNKDSPSGSDSVSDDGNDN